MVKQHWSLPHVHIVSLNTYNAPNVYLVQLLLIGYAGPGYKYTYRGQQIIQGTIIPILRVGDKYSWQ